MLINFAETACKYLTDVAIFGVHHFCFEVHNYLNNTSYRRDVSDVQVR